MGRTANKWTKQAERPLTSEARGISSNGSDLLVSGVIANLLLQPDLINKHREALAEYRPRKKNHAQLLSALLNTPITKETLDTGGLLTILEPQLYNVASDLLQSEAKFLAVPKNMNEMMRLMKQRPLLEEALERATQQTGNDLTEETYAAQQSLRSQKEAFDRRIYELTQHDMDP